jgi:hypothetical protein
MLKNIEMEYNKPVSTPMVIGSKLRKEDESKEANTTMNKFTIHTLLYVIA